MKPILVPKITEPCPKQWADLRGDDKRRFCEHCQLHVHNLSAMNAEERRELFSKPDERRCIAYRDEPGTTPVSTGTWRLWSRLPGSWRKVAALLAALLPMFLTQCSTPTPAPPTAPDTHACKQAGLEVDGKMVLGGVPGPPPPFWRRILLFWEN